MVETEVFRPCPSVRGVIGYEKWILKTYLCLTVFDRVYNFHRKVRASGMVKDSLQAWKKLFLSTV
jgi:hypothetical protein